MRSWYSKIASDSPLLQSTRRESHRKIIIPPAAHDVDGIVDQLSYKCTLNPVYLKNFYELHADYATRQFLQNCLDKYDKCSLKSWVRTAVYSCLRNFMTQTDALGTVGCGLMHIISTNQLDTLLRESYTREPLVVTEMAAFNKHLFCPDDAFQVNYGSLDGVTKISASSKPESDEDLSTFTPNEESIMTQRTHSTTTPKYSTSSSTSSTNNNGKKYGSLLDVGAGSGRMAEQFAPLFDIVECTEVSGPMVRAIEKKGFKAYHTADINTIPADKKYDVIGLFNLIDRCSNPITLLKSLKHRLKDQDSRLVIAVPLPLRPAVETKDGWISPEETIAPPGCYCGYTWEESVQKLIVDIIDPLYDVRIISRLPYLSEGDLKRSYHVLDDVILVLSLKKQPNNTST